MRSDGDQVRGDSKLTVEQVNAAWASRPHTTALVRALEGTLTWVPRDQNARADDDELSRQAYDDARAGTHRSSGLPRDGLVERIDEDDVVLCLALPTRRAIELHRWLVRLVGDDE